MDKAPLLSLMAAITGSTLLCRWWINHQAFRKIWEGQPDN